MFQNIISQSERKFASEHLRRNKQKMSAGKKLQKKNKLFYFKVCNFLGKILYCICKYFIMWDVQSHSIKRPSRNDLDIGCL